MTQFRESDREEFTRAFAIQFLASHAAIMYNEFCVVGKHDTLEHLPVVDAEEIAEKAFDHWLEIQDMEGR